MYEKLLDYVKGRMISHKSEVKLVLLFKQFTKKKQLKTEMRVNMMLVNDPKKAYLQAIERQESILFDETDIDEAEHITYANRPVNKIGQIVQAESSSDQADSKDDLQMYKQIKLVDKTRRAFETSIQSS